MRIILIVFSLLPLISICSPSILLSSPSFGGELHILAEGAGNATATITHPDKTVEKIRLEDGQAFINVSEAGKWKVQIGNETAIAIVQMPKDAIASGAEFSGQQISPFVWLVAICLVVIVLLGASAAIFFVAFPPAPPAGATLEKTRQADEIIVRLIAGSMPLESIELSDAPGADWDAQPPFMKAKSLEAMHGLELRYHYAGQGGEACARFIRAGNLVELKCREGKVRENIDNAVQPLGPFLAFGKKGQEKANLRKLERQ